MPKLVVNVGHLKRSHAKMLRLLAIYDESGLPSIGANLSSPSRFSIIVHWLTETLPSEKSLRKWLQKGYWPHYSLTSTAIRKQFLANGEDISGRQFSVRASSYPFTTELAITPLQRDWVERKLATHPKEKVNAIIANKPATLTFVPKDTDLEFLYSQFEVTLKEKELTVFISTHDSLLKISLDRINDLRGCSNATFMSYRDEPFHPKQWVDALSKIKKLTSNFKHLIVADSDTTATIQEWEVLQKTCGIIATVIL